MTGRPSRTWQREVLLTGPVQEVKPCLSSDRRDHSHQQLDDFCPVNCPSVGRIGGCHWVAPYLSARQGQGRIKSLINTREGAPIEPGVRETQVRSSELTGNLGIPSPGTMRTTISPSRCDVNSEFGPAKPWGILWLMFQNFCLLSPHTMPHKPCLMGEVGENMTISASTSWLDSLTST